MMIAGLLVLTATVALGTLLLVPRRPGTQFPARWRIAATHGVTGFAGLAIVIVALGSQAKTGSTGWAAVALIACGAVAGAILFLSTRHRRNPPALTLALHIVLAGMGTLLLAGFVLS